MTQRLATDEEVRAIQRALAARRLYGGEIDGIAGKQTRDAIRLYQAGVGREVTGVLTTAELIDLGVIASRKRRNPISDFFTRLVVNAALSKLKGLPIMNFLSGYKTIITGAVMVLVGALSLAAPIIGLDAVPGLSILSPGEAWTSMTTGFGLIFLRQGIKSA